MGMGLVNGFNKVTYCVSNKIYKIHPNQIQEKNIYKNYIFFRLKCTVYTLSLASFDFVS